MVPFARPLIHDEIRAFSNDDDSHAILSHGAASIVNGEGFIGLR